MRRDSSLLACVLGVFFLLLGMICVYTLGNFETSYRTVKAGLSVMGGISLAAGVVFILAAIVNDLVARRHR